MTLQQMRDSIVRRFAMTGISTSRITDADLNDIINMMRRKLCREADLRFGEQTSQIVGAIGWYNGPAPNGVARPYTLWYLSPSGGKVDLVEINKDEFDSRYPTPTDATKYGEPAHYTFWGNTLYVGPTMGRAITLTFNFYGPPADLILGGDEDDMNRVAWEAIYYGALVYVCQHLIEDARLPVFLEEYKAARNDLFIEAARVRSSGRIAQSKELA